MRNIILIKEILLKWNFTICLQLWLIYLNIIQQHLIDAGSQAFGESSAILDTIEEGMFFTIYQLNVNIIIVVLKNKSLVIK